MRYFLLIMALSFIACNKDDTPDPGSATAETMMDVSYGTHAQQKMDIFLPANRTTVDTRVMILIHGGAWSSGDKSDFTQYVDSLKKTHAGLCHF